MINPVYLIGFLIAAVVVVGLLAYVLQQLFRPSAIARLNKLIAEDKRVYGDGASLVQGAHSFLKQNISPLAKFAQPKQSWDVSPLRRDLLSAGFRTEMAGKIYLGMKTVLTLVFPLLFVAVDTLIPTLNPGPERFVFYLFVLAALGYMTPNVILSFMVKRRRKDLRTNFPDALDLMRICVEAGLTLDVAIGRVGEEMKVRSKALSDELHLVALEQRAGSPRNQALANLAMRAGIPEVDALVSTLIQAEKFGSSVSDSLRIHSENLRLTRRLEAEEQAAKIPTKILLPLILLIFPILFILIIAPAVDSVKRSTGAVSDSAAERH